MDNALTTAVNGLSERTELLFAVCIIIIIAIVLIRVIPMWDKHKQSMIDNDAKYREAQLAIERDRESRKMEESKQRIEREKENAMIMSRSIDAQERSTIAINESTAQMAVLAAKLEVSQQGSISMRDTVDQMAEEVHDIHVAVV